MRLFGWNISFYNPRRHAPVFYGIEHFVSGERVCRQFAKTDIHSVLMMISNRMKNVVYDCDVRYQATDAVFEFLRKNAFSILLKFFHNGFVEIDVSDPFNPCFSEECGERDQYILERRYKDNYTVVTLDEVYRSTGLTRSQVLSPHIDMLNTVNDSDLNLIMNYGAMGILSPENSARTDGYLDEDQIKEIQDDYWKKYGIRFGRWALLITKTPVKFQPITLPIKELELNEKRKAALAEILQYMNVPKELHAFFDSAKYVNRNEAELDMYGNTVSSWAQVFTDIAKRCYEAIVLTDDRDVKYVFANEFWFDIVGVPALQEAQQKEKEKVREEIAMWRELRSEMPEKSEEINKRIESLIENL